jgi:hypothetical protein
MLAGPSEHGESLSAVKLIALNEAADGDADVTVGFQSPLEIVGTVGSEHSFQR